jgi:hypothetical protein
MKLIARHPIWTALVAFVLYAMFVVPSLLMGSKAGLLGGTVACALFTTAIILGARSSTNAPEPKHPTSPPANRAWTLIRRPGGDGRP